MMLSSTIVAVLLLATLSGATTVIGVGLAIRLGGNVRALATGIGFSAGIMVTIALAELLPESVRQGGMLVALGSAGLGAALVGLLHFVIPHTHLVEEKGKFDAGSLKSAYLVAFGLILHDFPEGFAMANSYIASPSLGILVAVAIALHNIPEEFAMAVPAVALGKKRFLFRAAVVSGLAEPAGAVIGLVAVRIEPGLNAFLMALAAGAMIFVSIHELLPMAQRHGRLELFALGGVLSVVAYLALAWALPH